MHRITKATSLLLALVLIVSLAPAARAATVDSGTCGANLNWTYTDDGTLTITGTGNMKAYTTNTAPWWAYREAIKQLILPSGLTSIGEWAFYGLSNVTLTSLPAGLTSIGDHAFEGCTNLALTELPTGLKSMGDSAFRSCTSLALTSLPTGISPIKGYTFYNCPNLALTSLPVGVTSIGEYAFYSCANLALAELPAGVTLIGSSAFYNCFDLTLTSLPAGVTTIGTNTFSNCNVALTSLPDGLTSIGASAFSGCKNLALTELPAGLTSIDQYAFLGCIKLDLKSLPSGLTTIAAGAFSGCTKLALTSLPSGLKTIEATAFYNCPNLALTSLPDGLTSIGNSGFDGCTNLALTSLPNGLTSIASSAFSNCTNLALTSLPDGLTSIGATVFNNCTKLNLTSLPSGLTSIGNSAFYNCPNLTLTGLPSGIKSIGVSAFALCTKLALTKLPDSLESIGDSAFALCYNLALTSLPSGIISIGERVFRDCIRVALTEIPAGISIIGAEAFYGCTKQTTLYMRGAEISGAPWGAPCKTENIIWNVKKITLEDGSANAATVWVDGTKGFIPTTATQRPGYAVTSWSYSKNGADTYGDNTPITTDCNLYATWTARSDTAYKVEHYQQDVTGNGYALQDTDNLTGTTDAAVTATARTYPGFHELTDYASRVPSGSVAPDGSLTLKLFYDRDLHTVTFDSTGGTSIDMQTGIRFGGTAAEPTPPSKTGYDFGRWWADENCTIAYDFSASVTANMIVYASWTPRSDTVYKVEHYAQDVTGEGYTLRDTDSLTGTTDASVTASPKSYTGFTENTTHANRIPSGSVAPDGSLTLKLYYDRDLQTVTFDSKGGTIIQEQAGIRFGGSATEPTPPSKIGYDFGSWWADKNCTIAYGFSAPVTTDITVYASWTPRSDTVYKVEHYAQDVTGEGYTLRDTDSLTGITDASVTASPKTYTGFTENTTHANRIPSGSVAPDGSTVLKVYYDREIHRVAFDSKGGGAVASQNGIRFEGIAAEPPAPSKTGYDFAGWYADQNCTIAYDFATPVTTDITVYVSWTPRSDTAYKIEHYTQDVTGSGYTLEDTDNLTGTTDTTVTASPKTYTGFAENTTHANRIPSGSVAPDGSTVLKLYYDRNLNSITFDSKGGSAVAAQSPIRFEGTAAEPPVPSKTGYDFAGWYADENCTIAYDFATPVTTDITVYASWTPRSDTAYKVEHYQQDTIGAGYTLKETDSLTGSTDSHVAALARSYAGFYSVEINGAVSSGTVTPDGSLVLKLYYNRDLHTLTFDSRGGSSVDTQEGIRWGAVAIEPEAPNRIGYDFGGWWADEDCTIAFDFSAPITYNVAVYASWVPCTYTVTFDPNGGETDTQSIQTVYGHAYGDLPTPTKEHHIFVGWYTQADGGAKVVASDVMDKTQDSTLYAQWSNDAYGIVDGNVQDQNGNPVANAKITIRAGAVNYKTTFTDLTGRFTITNVKYGTYNLVVEKDARIVTSLCEVKSIQVTRLVVLPNGTTNSVIVVEENTPEIVVGGLDGLFGQNEVYTAPDTAIVDGGGKVELRLTIAEKKSEEAGADGQEISRSATKPLNMLLEMSITKAVYDAGATAPSTVTPLTELPELMTIIVPLSDEQRGKTGYTVYRSHGSSVDTISEEPNGAGEYISVQADQIILFACKFSMYALAFDVPTSSSATSVTATAGPGGKISPEGKTNVPYGASKTFTITPDAGYMIADVLVDGKSIGAVSSYKFSQVNTTHTIEALFHCPSSDFSDLDTSKWYHVDVDYVIDAGYMQGIGHGRWAPDQAMTRAEFLAVLARLQGAMLTPAVSNYEDVSATAWYAPAVAWAWEANIGLGYSQRRFGPDDTLTREQLALMLFRYSGSVGSSGNLTAYEDSGSISPWAKDAVVWAVNAGLLQGDDKGRLSPGGDITRAEVAAILKRFVEDQ